ncbi:MAG: PaaI family thioesterase [Microthrixaceae bacterium]|nr:PaaI family thioesterase [Microthrixaceae bacterium]
MTTGHETEPDTNDLPAEAGGHVPLHSLLGLEFEVPEEGSRIAEVRMPVRREAMGSMANLHGGAIATLVDMACALAAARCRGFDHTKETLVTSDMHVRYLGTHRSDVVVARAEVVKLGSRLIVVECKVLSGTGDDGDDHVIAVADFSMMVVDKRLGSARRTAGAQ